MTEVDCKNFILGPVDTDSISFCKPDQSPFSKEEQDALLEEINNLLPEAIQYDHDGYFKTVIIAAAKNYVLQDQEGNVKIKGSGLKASTKPPAMKELIRELIDSMLEDKNNYQDIYHKYIKEACNIKDIKRWASRKTISDKTLNSERKNETRIKDAIQGTEIVEGDRCYTYFRTKDQLELVERFDGEYSLDKMLQMCYDTSRVFKNVIDCETLFINYKLKKNRTKLQELIDEPRENEGRDYSGNYSKDFPWKLNEINTINTK